MLRGRSASWYHRRLEGVTTNLCQPFKHANCCRWFKAGVLGLLFNIRMVLSANAGLVCVIPIDYVVGKSLAAPMEHPCTLIPEEHFIIVGE